MTGATVGQTRQFRARVLAELGAGPVEIEELLRYGDNVFCRDREEDLSFPLADEPFVSAWEGYAECNRATGSISFLSASLVQLRFPISPGISQLPVYGDVTLRGRDPGEVAEASGIQLAAPERCQIVIHLTAAGRIPLLIAGEREDFVTLVRAFTRRNEPDPVPDSMGACMVAGYNNWSRIKLLRQAWERANPEAEGGWGAEFRRILPQKDLYQDRFIILSNGPYSDVPASAMGISDQEWRRVSLIIRREHECTHYFTRRVYSSMRNHLLDELLADFCGIAAVAGTFRADWFLRFVGLDHYPRYREGARLQNYRGDPPLSDSAFEILQRLVMLAAVNLERWSQQQGTCERACSPADPRLLMRLARFTLEELASSSTAILRVP